METRESARDFKNSRVFGNNLQENSANDENQNVNNDESKLLNIFPEEIWLKVLTSSIRLDPDSVNKASPFFQRLLHPYRTTFFFPSVWNILGVRYEVDSDPVYCDLKLQQSGSTRSWIYRERPVFLNVLKLRLVCRKWCLAIDTFYQNLYSHDTEESVNKIRTESGLDSGDERAIKRVYKDPCIRHWSVCKFDTEQQIQEFLDHFRSTHDSHRNPFPFRNVVLTFNASIQFFSKIAELLSKYGRHILFCQLVDKFHSCSQLQLFVDLQKMLCLMPNLEVIRFTLGGITFLNDPLPLTISEPERIKEAVETNPMPRLDKLTLVSFFAAPKLLMENFLGNNDQIKTIEWRSGHEPLYFAIPSHPNLTGLSICFTTWTAFQQFEKCGVHWSLKMLHLKFMFQVNDDGTFARIYKCFEQWKHSLVDVVIFLPVANEVEIARNLKARLDLPFVKRLRIVMPNLISMDLILPMRNTLELLEYIRGWDLRKDWKNLPEKLRNQMKTEEVIQFHSVQKDDMYYSNIWSLFPKLGRIHDNTGSRYDTAYVRHKNKAVYKDY